MRRPSPPAQRVALSFVQPFRDYIDSLVHPSVQQDPLTATRHRAFIAPRLLGSLIALAAFPVYLAARGVPSALEIAVFAWLVIPILIAYFLSRTGRYEGAHILSSLSLTGLVFVVACKTGGISSFAAIWLVVVPLEAALSASRRVVAVASTFALLAAGLLLVMQNYGLTPAPAAAARIRACLRHSGSFRLRSMRPDWRSARNCSPAPASGCSTRRRTATACWPAT